MCSDEGLTAIALSLVALIGLSVGRTAGLSEVTKTSYGSLRHGATNHLRNPTMSQAPAR